MYLSDIRLSIFNGLFSVEGADEELDLYEDGVRGRQVIVEDWVRLIALYHYHLLLNNNILNFKLI